MAAAAAILDVDRLLLTGGHDPEILGVHLPPLSERDLEGRGGRPLVEEVLLGPAGAVANARAPFPPVGEAPGPRFADHHRRLMRRPVERRESLDHQGRHRDPPGLIGRLELGPVEHPALLFRDEILAADLGARCQSRPTGLVIDAESQLEAVTDSAADEELREAVGFGASGVVDERIRGFGDRAASPSRGRGEGERIAVGLELLFIVGPRLSGAPLPHFHLRRQRLRQQDRQRDGRGQREHDESNQRAAGTVRAHERSGLGRGVGRSKCQVKPTPAQ